MPAFLENLTDEELKKEAKNEAKNDALSAIIKAIKCLVSRVPSQEETAKNLEIFRLKMILRLVNQCILCCAYLLYYSFLCSHSPISVEYSPKWYKKNAPNPILLLESAIKISHSKAYSARQSNSSHIRNWIKFGGYGLQNISNQWELIGNLKRCFAAEDFRKCFTGMCSQLILQIPIF